MCVLSTSVVSCDELGGFRRSTQGETGKEKRSCLKKMKMFGFCFLLKLANVLKQNNAFLDVTVR